MLEQVMLAYAGVLIIFSIICQLLMMRQNNVAKSLLNFFYAESDDPWYVADKSSNSRKSDRWKDSMDPMNDMKHYLTSKKKCLEPPRSTQVI
jgi:hypothetical protein